MSRYDGIDLSPPKRQAPPAVPAEPGMVLEEVLTGWVGAVVASDKENVTLEDRHRRTRVFPLGVFLLDGRIRFQGALQELRMQTGEARLERAIAQLMREAGC